MTKIDIYSGFLGAGKTTLIKKMIEEGYRGQKLVLIENEFGEIGIDGGFLQDAGINITEMNSGCICCSLVGDFGKALAQVIQDYHPDRVLIEPSGVGKLSDVIAAVNKVEGVELGFSIAVVDAGKVKVYMKNFGEFYNNQVETADIIILSRTDIIPHDKLDKAMELLRERNSNAVIVTTPWNELSGEQLLHAMEGKASVAADLEELEQEHRCCGHHHHEEHHCCCGHGHHEHEHEEHCCGGHSHHEHEGHHCCGQHHEHDHHEHEHGEHCCCGHDHHEHHHDEHCYCGHDHHEHHHDEHCSCGHDHHEHHHADEVFTSWGIETHKKYSLQDVENALCALDSGEVGTVLRAKGIVACAEGGWIHFDFVPGEVNVRMGTADVIGKLCVIGAQLNEAGIAALFAI